MSSEKLRPLADRLVVELIEQEDVTPSGLFIPDTAKEKPQQGTVIAVGPGRLDEDGQRISMDVSVGDTVLFAKYAGTDFKLNGQKLLILKESDVLAIVEGSVNSKKSLNEGRTPKLGFTRAKPGFDTHP